jgi:hypothetical protein
VAGGETGADATGEEMSAWYSGVNVRTPGDVASAELDLAPEAVLFRDVLSQLSHFCQPAVAVLHCQFYHEKG